MCARNWWFWRNLGFSWVFFIWRSRLFSNPIKFSTVNSKSAVAYLFKCYEKKKHESYKGLSRKQNVHRQGWVFIHQANQVCCIKGEKQWWKKKLKRLILTISWRNLCRNCKQWIELGSIWHPWFLEYEFWKARSVHEKPI